MTRNPPKSPLFPYKTLSRSRTAGTKSKRGARLLTATSSAREGGLPPRWRRSPRGSDASEVEGDRKSTRLNSSHQIISYAVFCLKKKKHLRRTAIPCTALVVR